MTTPLVDNFGRTIEYLRLSVTDRCDLRCTYCIPKGFDGFEEPENWLSFNEIEQVVRCFTELGVKRVRLTGGEPLVRKNVSELATRLGALPQLEDMSMSTNAVKLAKHASTLRQAGISRLNISLDSLRVERFKSLTQGPLNKVLDGIAAAKDAGFSPIKINMVAMKGINDDEFVDMVEYCSKHGFTLRFIETMPMGSTGQQARNHYQDLQEVKSQLSRHYDLVPTIMNGGGPARYFKVKQTGLKIGFITPISQHFCETCNRVRIGVDGTLYMCLGQDNKVELRPLLRQGISDDGLKEVLINAMALKPERHEFKEKPLHQIRIMSLTGG